MFIQGTHAADYERQARGYVWLWPGIYTPSVAMLAVLAGRQVSLTQEQPWHPAPFLAPGVRPVTVPVLPTNWSIVAQEQPWHPARQFVHGVIVPALVAVQPEQRWRFTTQEQPGHPLPFTWTPRPPVLPVQPGRKIIQATQEQPWHPQPFVWFGVSPVNFVAGRGTTQGYIL